MIPTRGTAAKYAKHILTIDFNDIDIFIEDTKKGYRKVYVLLMSRLFSNKYKINDVHPLGSRDIVIETCNKKQGKVVRPSLFIVDGDLWLLKGELNPLPKGVYRLPRYSIENILINEESILDFLEDEHDILLYDELKEKLNFDNWVARNQNHLINLFLHYAILQKRNIREIKTIKYKVSKLTKDNSEFVDEDLVKSRIEECKVAIINNIGQENYERDMADMKIKLTNDDCKLLCHVAGKDYLWPLLKKLFKTFMDKEVSTTNFAIRMAKTCPVDFLANCENFILNPKA